jgi:membrane protease YdiL (CAAX protease family)
LEKAKIRKNTLFGIIMLLVFRFIILAGIGSFAKPQWLGPIFEIGSYAFILFLLWSERKELRDSNVDAIAFILIPLMKTIEVLIIGKINYSSIISIQKWGGKAILFMTFIFIVIFILNRKDFIFPKVNKMSFMFPIIGFLAGIFLSIFLAFPMSFQIHTNVQHFEVSTLVKQNTFEGILFQIGYAAISEEPLFRAFLWGILIRIGMKEWKVFFLQVILFTLGHIYYFSAYPISLFIITPLCAAAFGLLVLKTKTISSSILAHGVFNGTANLMGQMVAAWRV